jgi:hypothetical protein
MRLYREEINCNYPAARFASAVNEGNIMSVRYVKSQRI